MVKEIQQENTVTITRESERKHGNTLPYYYSVNLCNPSPLHRVHQFLLPLHQSP